MITTIGGIAINIAKQIAAPTTRQRITTIGVWHHLDEIDAVAARALGLRRRGCPKAVNIVRIRALDDSERVLAAPGTVDNAHDKCEVDW